jgi:hypothetical protein
MPAQPGIRAAPRISQVLADRAAEGKGTTHPITRTPGIPQPAPRRSNYLSTETPRRISKGKKTTCYTNLASISTLLPIWSTASSAGTAPKDSHTPEAPAPDTVHPKTVNPTMTSFLPPPSARVPSRCQRHSLRRLWLNLRDSTTPRVKLFKNWKSKLIPSGKVYINGRTSKTGIKQISNGKVNNFLIWRELIKNCQRNLITLIPTERWRLSKNRSSANSKIKSPTSTKRSWMCNKSTTETIN